MSGRIDDLVAINLDARKLSHGWTMRLVVGGKVTERKVPGLVEQLRAALVMQSSDGGGNASGKAVTPQMPGTESALSLLVEIETEVARLAVWLGASAASQVFRSNLAFVEKACDMASDEAVREVARVLGRLTQLAEVELEWEVGSRRLHAHCPMCRAFGSILIHLDVAGLAGATCGSCQAVWGRADLGSLGAQVQGGGS